MSYHLLAGRGVLGNFTGLLRNLSRLLLAALVAVATLAPPASLPAYAAGEERTLYLHHTHTGQTGKFTFKRNGKYDAQVLKELNVFLADWRTKEPTKMDPALFDLLWSVYREVGGKQPINIVSSYRSPKTNAMLASKSSGVADNSQHMRGKAMDFFIPGINLSTLRAVAMKHQVGGVGYYPTSGSPFVHLDTGSVRAWPRMTRAQLKKVFPDGKTLHLPTDGKPLSSAGRAYAQAQWTKCHAVPCDGRVTFDTNPGIMVAEADGGIAPIPAKKPGRSSAGEATITLASAEEPTQRQVTSVVAAPLPLARPAKLSTQLTPDVIAVAALSPENGELAPIPLAKPPRIQLATRAPLGNETGETALAALTALDASGVSAADADKLDDVITAYAATDIDPGAQLALKMIIERETTASLPALPATKNDILAAGKMQVASFAGAPKSTAPAPIAPATGADMFAGTFAALEAQAAPRDMADALAGFALDRQPMASLERRATELVAPELDHVNVTLVQPVLMATAFWAEMSDAEGYLEKATELGPLTGSMGFVAPDAAVPAYDRFVADVPVLISSL
jgi:uncharacterized protein YcbK (DUF882 family)